MTIHPGLRLGPYEVLSALGAGGMGEVWRARDTRLDRDVAIKVLPADFAANAQLRLRFDREARTISSLNHPHICTLHDVGKHEGIDYLVMEMIEGESLADRLKKGPLPLEQVLRFGAQIATALDVAHRRGIVHRDLKPGNVMLTKAGAKLLDFGLAKPAGESAIAPDAATAMATAAKPLTQEGTILGTFQYMAPEQLEGVEADARTDIFALGCVLYEMATGRRAFEAGSKTSLIAAIVSSQPAPISALAPMSPPALDHVVSRCLGKSPEDRWQSAQDVATELTWISEAGSQSGVAAPLVVRRKSRERIAWALVALLLAAVAAGSWPLARRVLAERDLRPVRLNLVNSDGKQYVYSGNSYGAVVSPDGRRLAFVTKGPGGSEMLMVRPLNGSDAQPLAGTEGAAFPFWSPDSAYLGFFAEGKLKKIEANGGPAVVIAPAATARGGSWGPDDTILFSPDTQSAIFRVSASGGTPVAITQLESERGVSSHRWPWILPGGESFLFVTTGATVAKDEINGVYAARVDGKGRPARIMDAVSRVEYSSGLLLWVREGFLNAQRFDPVKLKFSGQPATLAEQVRTRYDIFALAYFSASDSGLLAYESGSFGELKLALLDRTGAELRTVGDAAGYQRIRLSPDGKRLAVSILDAATGTSDIWVLETERDVRTRITFDPGNDTGPVWSPDGTKLAFSSQRKGFSQLLVKPAAGGTAEQVVFESKAPKSVEDWSSDGYISFNMSGKMKDDLWVMRADGTGKPLALVTTGGDDGWGTFSPDAKWIAYLSNENGRYEAFAMRFPPQGGGKWQISTKGADWLLGWRADGKELYYMDLEGTVQAIPVTIAGTELEVGAAKPLFPTEHNMSWTSSTDGEHFIVGREVGGALTRPTTVVMNWQAAVK